VKRAVWIYSAVAGMQLYSEEIVKAAVWVCSAVADMQLYSEEIVKIHSEEIVKSMQLYCEENPRVLDLLMVCVMFWVVGKVFTFVLCIAIDVVVVSYVVFIKGLRAVKSIFIKSIDSVEGNAPILKARAGDHAPGYE
jgi:hypothetical protein